MVLQQKMNVPIWGWASPGEKVNVTASWSRNITLKTLAGPDGKWMVKLKTPRAGGPYDMVVKGNTTKLLHGILIGEVWICSGQSNMEMPVGGWDNTPINNSKEEIAAANYPDIRLFTVSKKIAIEPEQDVSGSWASSTPGSVSKFSATAYFFGRALGKKLGVPVGLIHTSWGGTVAEAWTSAGALHKLGDFDNELKKLDSIKPHLPELVLKEKEENILWNKALTNKNSEYAQVNFDDKEWKKMNLPGAWENSGYPDLDGIVWFRKLIEIPASWSGKKLKLDLGPVDDYDVTYFNGDEIGSTTKEGSWNLNRNYEIPAKLVHAGPNLITIKVTDLGGGGGLTGDQKLLKLYLDESSNEESLALAGEWSFNIEAVKPNYVDKNPNVPSVLYNGMIAPLIPYAIKGAIWYQGEANVGRATQYEKLFPAMIADWRSKWKQGPFPFYFVQIAP
ncbi:MAG TPA: sialate O-acetylesterase, partial [Flavisolibacter sp.]|nr:sialate O-acetylesterase [Flavisolibacter sp.]